MGTVVTKKQKASKLKLAAVPSLVPVDKRSFEDQVRRVAIDGNESDPALGTLVTAEQDLRVALQVISCAEGEDFNCVRDETIALLLRVAERLTAVQVGLRAQRAAGKAVAS